MQTREPIPDNDARTLHEIRPFDPTQWRLPPMISTDTHVIETPETWAELPARLAANVPKINFGGPRPPGASDPHLRVIDQDTDGVGADIIFPNYGMALFALDDVETQQVAMRLYNDWIADFCKVAPKRLFGVACISVYDIDAAVVEMHRALDMGLVGIMVWQVPDPRLPFSSDHYEKLWAAAAEAKTPVHTHILTGHSYMKDPSWPTTPIHQRIKNSVNRKQYDTMNGLYDLIFSGVFDRHPDLRLVLAESEVGWAPYILQQWDYYHERFFKEATIVRKPSEIFDEHVYCTFLEDFAGTRHLGWWGQHNCMWSNDYPHFNMTFPNSRANVVRHIGDLPYDAQVKLVRGNALSLYGLDV